MFQDCPSETDVDLETLCWLVRLPKDSILTARLAISRASAGPSVLTTKPWGLPGVGVWGNEQGKRGRGRSSKARRNCRAFLVRVRCWGAYNARGGEVVPGWKAAGEMLATNVGTCERAWECRSHRQWVPKTHRRCRSLLEEATDQSQIQGYHSCFQSVCSVLHVFAYAFPFSLQNYEISLWKSIEEESVTPNLKN